MAYELPESKSEIPPITLKLVQNFNIFLQLLGTKAPRCLIPFEKFLNPPMDSTRGTATGSGSGCALPQHFEARTATEFNGFYDSAPDL